MEKPCAVTDCPALATKGDWCPVHEPVCRPQYEAYLQAEEQEDAARSRAARERIARLYQTDFREAL